MYEARPAADREITQLVELSEASRNRLLSLRPPIIVVTHDRMIIGGIALLPSAGMTVALNSESKDSAVRVSQAVRFDGGKQVLHLAEMRINVDHQGTVAFGHLMAAVQNNLSMLIDRGAHFDYVTAVPANNEERNNLEHIGFRPDADVPRIFTLTDPAYFTGFRRQTI